MNINDYCTELYCIDNLSFLLNDAQMYSKPAHKILLNCKLDCIIPCSRMIFNGREQLYYLTGSYSTLKYVVKELSSVAFVQLVANLTEAINLVKSNGFINTSNLLISSDHIFVDTDSKKVKLIYLPINSNLHINDHSFENDVRLMLLELIDSNSNLSDLKDELMYRKLLEGSFGLEQPVDFIQKERYLVVRSVNSDINVRFRINEDTAIIGRSSNHCDCVIDDATCRVSRQHCEIKKENNRFFVRDLGSSHGTFLNECRLQAGECKELRAGDRLRVAHVTLSIEIGRT